MTTTINNNINNKNKEMAKMKDTITLPTIVGCKKVYMEFPLSLVRAGRRTPIADKNGNLIYRDQPVKETAPVLKTTKEIESAPAQSSKKVYRRTVFIIGIGQECRNSNGFTMHNLVEEKPAWYAKWLKVRKTMPYSENVHVATKFFRDEVKDEELTPYIGDIVCVKAADVAALQARYQDMGYIAKVNNPRHFYVMCAAKYFKATGADSVGDLFEEMGVGYKKDGTKFYARSAGVVILGSKQQSERKTPVEDFEHEWFQLNFAITMFGVNIAAVYSFVKAANAKLAQKIAETWARETFGPQAQIDLNRRNKCVKFCGINGNNRGDIIKMAVDASVKAGTVQYTKELVEISKAIKAQDTKTSNVATQAIAKEYEALKKAVDMIKTELPGFVNSFEQQFANAAAFIETVQDQLSKADERDDRYFKEIELLKAENAQLKAQLSNNDNEPDFEQQDDIDLGDGDGDTPFSNCESEQPKPEEPIAQPESEIPVEQPKPEGKVFLYRDCFIKKAQTKDLPSLCDEAAFALGCRFIDIVMAVNAVTKEVKISKLSVKDGKVFVKNSKNEFEVIVDDHNDIVAVPVKKESPDVIVDEQLPKTPVETPAEQPAVIPVKFNKEQLAKIFAPRDFSATGHINPEPEIARLKAEWSAAVETAGKAITMFNVDIDTFIYMVTWSFQTKIHDIKIKDGDVWIKGTAKSRLNMLYTGQTGWFKVIPAEHKKNFIAADFLSVWDAKVSMGF